MNIFKYLSSDGSSLDLSSNRLTEIPKEIAKLTNLTHLDLSSSQLKEIPKEIAKLTNLTSLDLSYNKLTEIPKEIAKLTNLTSLDLNSNQLTKIPKEIAKLTNLTDLDLRNNKLKEIPKEIAKNIQLDKEIMYDSVGIFAYNNPLVSPPLELIKNEGETLTKYYEALNEGSIKLKEVKIIFIGEGNAGKTSIINRITQNIFHKNEPKTHGVRVHEKEDQGKKIYFWDFGGQDIMHSTHQFFLSNRCIYVLVLDGRRDEKPRYWLDMIKTFGGDSPIFVAMNKKEESDRFDINKTSLQKDYQSIVDFIELDCELDNDKGTKEFKDKLLNFIHKSNNEQLSLNVPIPTKWNNIKDRLSKSSLNYQECDSFYAMCDEEEIDVSHREILLSLLHELGIMLHFKGEDILLENYFVLKPKWVLDAAYKIINSPIANSSNGKIINNQVFKILNYSDSKEHKQYPELEHFRYKKIESIFILSLFEEFKLGYMIGKDMLIPDLLPSEHEDYKEFGEDSIHVMYKYNFMPPSVMPQIIVNLHEDIKENIVWKNGVLLNNTTLNCEAEVISEKEHKTINIKVSGADKKEYLAIIRNVIDKINAKLNEETTKPELYLIIANSNCKPISYRYLKSKEKAGDITHRPEATDSDFCEEYKIQDLLGGIRTKDEAETLIIETILEELKSINNKLSQEDVEEKIMSYKANFGVAEINLGAIYNKINDVLIRSHSKYMIG